MHFFVFINIGKGMVILMKKTILSLFLSFTLIICIIPQSTYAQSSRDTSFEEELATDLKALGLFKGVSDTNFDLNREPTRVEALVMLIRVLGKEAEALNSNNSHPFTDVPTWADKYVGYAYGNGLTKGTSATTFGTENANSAMYITFVLRALGYSDVAGEDFTWDNPYILAKKIGILPTFVNTSDFLRADAVTVSYAALRANLKNSEIPLEMFLEELGVFDSASFIDNYDKNAIGRKESELTSTAKELSPQEIFNACSPAVFYIDIWDESSKSLNIVGGGFFITPDGVAVTNYHVLENADAASVWLPNKTGYSVLGVLYFDKNLDFAVIKTNATNVPYLNIGDSLDVYSGDEIYTIGNPQGLTNTISNGIVSNPCRDDFNRMIQITAPISPGSSGGALLNSRGEVIGITTATLTSGQNLNFAVPINDVVNRNEVLNIENKYNMLTMEQFATINGAYDKIEPPKNIRVVRQQNSSAHIQWDEVEGAEYYHFYYQEAGEDTFWFDEDDNGNKLKFEYCNDYTVSYNGLENGKIYNVIVTSVKNGVESNDSEILTFVFKQNENDGPLYSYNKLNEFLLRNYNHKINNSPTYQEVTQGENGRNYYSITCDDGKGYITLTSQRGFNGATVYASIGLRPERGSYFCMFGYTSPTSNSNSYDFTGTYHINSTTFGENSTIKFEKTTGSTQNQDLYSELAKLMNLEMINFADYVFATKLSNTGCSMSDFGFAVENSNNSINGTVNNYPSGNNAPTNNYQGDGGYSTNTKITLSSFPLYLYADDGTGTFLGEISSNKYDTDSIANEYGNYGSKYQTKSIFNQYGNYGSKYSQYSVFNEYATHPPKILDKNGKVVGYLTSNKYIRDAISYEEMMFLLKKFNK